MKFPIKRKENRRSRPPFTKNLTGGGGGERPAKQNKQMKYLLSISAGQLVAQAIPNDWFQIVVNAIVSISTVYIYSKYKK